jgi:pimeloyl-ACP methyl ester carboxylesterase
MANFVVAHGAWSSAWAWKKMRPLMRAAGHELWTPTYTGLGERAHLAHADVSLDTHIQDVIAMLEMEDLRDVILVGHSYGGMVATGVADRARARIRHLVYLDAFAPKDGQSVFDLLPPDIVAKMQVGAAASASGFGIPSNPMPSDTAPEDVAWAATRRLPQPIKAFSTKLRLSAEPTMPRTYIYAKKAGIGDTFRQFAARAKAEQWQNVFEIDSSHNPHITNPQALLEILNKVAAA